MISLIACAKNEKPYLSEWLSYHLNLGFDKIMLFDNGGNGELKSNGKIEVYDAPGDRIQLQSYAFALSQMKYNDWCFVCDVDEFLNIGGLSVQDFLKPYQGIDVVKLNWVVYR